MLEAIEVLVNSARRLFKIRTFKFSSGFGAPRPTDDSGSYRGARAPRRHQLSGYDSEGCGRAWGLRRRPHRGRSSSLEPEARRWRKSRKSCRSDSDSARSKDTDDSSDLDSDAASDRSLTQEYTSTKERGVSFGCNGAHAPSSQADMLARGSDQGSKWKPFLDLQWQASDSAEVLRLCAHERLLESGFATLEGCGSHRSAGELRPPFGRQLSEIRTFKFLASFWSDLASCASV